MASGMTGWTRRFWRQAQSYSIWVPTFVGMSGSGGRRWRPAPRYAILPDPFAFQAESLETTGVCLLMLTPAKPPRLGRWRRLALGERALAAQVFGDSLDAGRVRVLAIPLWTRAFVAGGGLIVWPARAMRADFAAADAPVAVQAMFVHELVHVWQAQHGLNLLLAKLRAGDGPAAYAYDLAGRPRFATLNLEQQAMVVEDAFKRLHGAAAPHAASAYAAVLEDALPVLATRLGEGPPGGTWPGGIWPGGTWDA